MYVVHSPTGSPHGPSRFEPCHTYIHLSDLYIQSENKTCLCYLYVCMYVCYSIYQCVCTYMYVCIMYICVLILLGLRLGCITVV